MITRLNHAVIKVRDLDRSVAFYERVLGMQAIDRMGSSMAFLRAQNSSQHHDLGLLAVGSGAPDAPQRAPGLFHLAWQVERIEELAEFAHVLETEGALSGASDHGAAKSIYGVDPDGNEFEILWPVPREAWGEYEQHAITQRLDLPAEIARWRGYTATAPVTTSATAPPNASTSASVVSNAVIQRTTDAVSSHT